MSKRIVRIGLVQLRWNPDHKIHKSALKNAAKEAVDRGAQLICFQEITFHSYFPSDENSKDLSLAEPIPDGPSSKFFADLSKEFHVHIIGSIFEKEVKDNSTTKYYNTAVIFDPKGGFVGLTRKQHIPSGTGYHEDYYFEPGFSDYPVYDLGFIKVAIPTCYDQWFPELSRIYGLKGAELIVYPTAIGSEPDFPGFDSQAIWTHVISAQSAMNGVFIAAVNRIGNEGILTFYGSSFVSDPTGRIISQASRIHPATLVVDLDFDVFDFWRKLFPLLEQRQPSSYQLLTEKDHEKKRKSN